MLLGENVRLEFLPESGEPLSGAPSVMPWHGCCVWLFAVWNATLVRIEMVPGNGCNGQGLVIGIPHVHM